MAIQKNREVFHYSTVVQKQLANHFGKIKAKIFMNNINLKKNSTKSKA